MDFTYSDEQKLIRETAREFAEGEILPQVKENDRAERFDRELARKLGEIGFLGAPVAEEYGGRGLDYVSYGLIAEEIGRADSSARTVVSVVTSLVAGPIEKWGSEEQKQRWLPRLCSGEGLGCFGLTEPDTGSDAANLRTRATKTDGGWSISGQKMWISLGNHSEVALIFAQTDPEKQHRGLAAFLVPTKSEGFSSQEIHGKMGLHGSDTAELTLDSVRVDDDALMGEVGDGFKIAMSALDSGRYSVAAGCVGICQGSLDASVAYAKQREQFGRPLASFQLVQDKLSRMVGEITAMQLLCLRLSELAGDERLTPGMASLAKYSPSSRFSGSPRASMYNFRLAAASGVITAMLVTDSMFMIDLLSQRTDGKAHASGGQTVDRAAGSAFAWAETRGAVPTGERHLWCEGRQCDFGMPVSLIDGIRRFS